MFEKTVLITGANTGIGEAAARELARRGAKVIFACRNEAKTQPVIDSIARETGNTKLSFVKLELDDLRSVERCAASITEPIDVLVLNAGVARIKGLTAQGFEFTFGVNHLGHFALTMGLKERLLPGSRVVTVASRAHERRSDPIDYSALRKPQQSMTGWPEYQQSKLANMLFSNELARQWKDRGVHTYALHPGVIASDLWRNVPQPLRAIALSFMRTPQQGAVATIRCATDPALKDETGGYYGEDGQPRQQSALAADHAAAAELWSYSLSLWGEG